MQKTALLPLALLLVSCTLVPEPDNGETIKDIIERRTGTGALAEEDIASSSSSSSVESTSSVAPAGDNAEFVEEVFEEETVLQEPESIERLLVSGLLEIGGSSAPVTMLLFTEHACGYCRDFHHDILPRLQSAFVDPGTLKLQIAVKPLQKYPGGEDAARALICAAKQSKGIAMHDRLFGLSSRDRSSLLAAARETELDEPLFTACFDEPGTQTLVDAHTTLAESLGVTVVPTYFLNGEKYEGLPYWSDLEGSVQEMENE